MNAQQNKEKGFTIIEVVLVLAIAGLIFLMVFIALPALQANQRDTQRKNDLSRALTEVNNYQSNNRNKLPNGATGWEEFKTNYLITGSETFEDPSRGTYQLSVDTTGADLGAFDNETATIQVVPGAVCDGESLDMSAGSNEVALRIKLEGGGIACSSN